jgi:ribosome-binding factor A
MPVSNDVSEVEWVEVTDDIQKRNVYASLQRAWQKKRDAGRLAKRAAEEEEKKK